jgi:hypothetical protein
MANNVALVVIFNHRYDNNIEKLEAIYSGRFTNIYYLIPFYDGNRSDVIPVYENSYYYQGYIAQGYKSYYKEEYSHYFFIADDLILNPLINEGNFMQHLKLNEKSCFIPEILSLHNIHGSANTRYGFNYTNKKWGVEAVNEIPSYEEAMSAFDKFGLKIQPLSHNQAFEKQDNYENFKDLVKVVIGKKKPAKRYYDLSYPLVNAFSDMLVITKKVIKKFSHYCGAFAANELFVELAIPTALVFTAEAISTENDLELHGKYLHTEQELKELDRFNNKLSDLLTSFPAGYLYLHPVKLSQWKNDII